MIKMLIVVVTTTLALQALSLSGASPAVAISVDLAKKCREMAIKAHPPESPGTKAYAQAERDFFRECVAKKWSDARYQITKRSASRSIMSA